MHRGYVFLVLTYRYLHRYYKSMTFRKVFMSLCIVSHHPSHVTLLLTICIIYSRIKSTGNFVHQRRQKYSHLKRNAYIPSAKMLSIYSSRDQIAFLLCNVYMLIYPRIKTFVFRGSNTTHHPWNLQTMQLFFNSKSKSLSNTTWWQARTVMVHPIQGIIEYVPL